MRIISYQNSLKANSVKKVLIYRLGCIGDTVVALPALRLVARAFPYAQRKVLTVFPNGAKVAPMDSIIGPINLVHGYYCYPMSTRDPRTLLDLLRTIRQWKPEVLVYCNASRGRLKTVRDALFFKACGIRHLIGVPWTMDLQECRRTDNPELWESEARRLLRGLATLDNGLPAGSLNWDLKLTTEERATAEKALSCWPESCRFVCASIGTKACTKDWGFERWAALFRLFSLDAPGAGLVLVGSSDEHEPSDRLSREWQGPTLNLCGQLTPRETAAVMERAVFFAGHDSGPMHLAAAAGTPCIAIFSAQNLPGEWYPFGDCHRIFYQKTHCFGCRLTNTCPHDKICIKSISIDNVLESFREFWIKYNNLQIVI